MENTEISSFVERKKQVLSVIDQYFDMHQLQEEIQANALENAVALDSTRNITEAYLQDYITLYSQLTGVNTDESFKNIFMGELQRIASEPFSIETDNKQMKFVLFLFEHSPQHRENISQNIRATLANFKHCLPLKILLKLKHHRLLHLEEFIRENINNNQTLKEFVLRLQTCLASPNEGINENAADLLSCLINSGYKSSGNNDKAMLKVCQYILQFVFRHVLTKLGDSTHEPHGATRCNSVFVLLQSSAACTSETLRSCYLHQFVIYLTHNPVLKVSEATSKQSKWTSCNMSNGLAKAYEQVFMVCDLDDAISIVKKAFLKEQVNWKSVLTFVSSVLTTFKDAALLIEGFIAKEIKKGLEGNCTDNLIIGLLLARQCSYEGGHLFMSYSEWFQKYFGSGSDCLITSARSFRFFIKFLTSLVPFEPLQYIKVHVSKRLHVPNQNLKALLQEYVALARTRIDDLKPSGDDDAEHSILSQEVDDAAAMFGKCGRIPSFIMEMSIFRKSHFTDKFLPILLRARPLPDVADNKMELIAALLKFGKISRSLYDTYKRKCDVESLKLYEEAIDLENDFEDTSSPIEHFKAEIMGYFSALHTTNEPDLCKIGQPLNRRLHQLLPHSTQNDDMENTNATIDVTTRKEFGSSLENVRDTLLDVLSSLDETAIDFRRLVYLLKIIESYPVLKEAICHRVWKDCVSEVKDKDCKPDQGFVLILLGCLCKENWVVCFETKNPLHGKESSTIMDEKEVSSLPEAVLSSLPYSLGATSFLNSARCHLALARQIQMLKNMPASHLIASTTQTISKFLTFAKLKLEYFVQKRICKGGNGDSEAAKRPRLEKEDELASINLLLHEVKEACEHLGNVLPGESGSALKLAEFIKLEMLIRPERDILSERCRRQFYKQVLFQSTVSSSDLQSVAELLLDKCTNNSLGNNQIISTFCENLDLLLQVCDCFSPAEWMLSLLGRRVAHVSMNSSVQLRKEASIRLEVSNFVCLLLALPSTTLYHQATASDANSSWTQVSNEMEDVCQTVKTFMNDYVKEYFNKEIFYSDLVPHLLSGLIKTASEDHPSLLPYLSSHIPLLLASALVQWNDMPDAKCVAKIRQAHFHEAMTNFNLSTQAHSAVTSDVILNVTSNDFPLYPWCLAFFRFHGDADVMVTVKRIEQVSSSMPEIYCPIITCLIACTGQDLENYPDLNFERPSRFLETLLPKVAPSTLFQHLSEEAHSLNAMFSASVCKVHFYIAFLRLLSLVNLPENFQTESMFLPVLLAAQNKVNNQCECLESKVQLLFIKSARSSTTALLKRESQNPSNSESIKTILKTEIHKRYR